MDVSVLEQVVATHVPMVQRLSVPQFHQMLEQGILREGEPVELIDGLLIRKDRSDRGGDPILHGPLHAFAITRLQRLGLRLGGLGCHLRCQLPVTLSDLLEPEPDAAIVRGEPEDYIGRHPGPADTIATIEIADSSLNYDRTTKQQIYANAGISAYWVVSISERTIEVYTSPQVGKGRYEHRSTAGAGQVVRLKTVADQSLEVAVDELLP